MLLSVHRPNPQRPKFCWPAPVFASYFTDTGENITARLGDSFWSTITPSTGPAPASRFHFVWRFLHILSPSECCKSRFFASALGCIAQRRKTNAKDAPPHLPRSFPPGCTVAKGKLIIWKYYLRAIMLKYGAFDNSSTQTNKDTQPYKRHTTMHNTPTCVHRCIRTRQRTWRLLFGGHNLTWSPITCPSAPSPSTGTLLSRTKQRTAKPSQTRDKAKTVSY